MHRRERPRPTERGSLEHQTARSMISQCFYDACAAYYDGDYDSAGYDDDVPFYVELARESG